MAPSLPQWDTMDLGEKTNIQEHTCCLRSLDIHGVNLHPPAQHQSIPKDMGMCFAAVLRGSQGWQCHRDWAVPGTWSSIATGWRSFPKHRLYDHFPNFHSTYSFFHRNFTAREGPLSFLAKPEHFSRACLVQYVGIFSLFTLTTAHCCPCSCSIYPTGNS